MKSKFSILLLIVFEILLINLPLLNSIGYEFAFVNGIFLFIFSGFFIISKNREANYSSLFNFIFEEWKYFLALFLIPFFVGILSSIYFSSCPLKDGIEFYFVICLVSIINGLLLGQISILITRRFLKLTFSFLFVLMLSFSLYEFYLYPQVYSYNQIYGFFPGTIYDEDLAVDFTLIMSQIFGLISSTLLLFIVNYFNRKYSRKIFARIFVVVFLILTLLVKPFFGFATDEKTLVSQLPLKIETDNFIIHLDKKIPKTELETIALLHEYYFEQVEEKLNVRFDNKIHSFIFYDAQQKRKLFGAGNADVSKPWLNQIYLNYNSLEQTLKHEIAHVIASKFGTTIFKVAKDFNPALIEGLAMYVEDDFDGYPIDYASSLIIKKYPNVDLKNLFESFNFFKNYSSVSYILAGSFIKFLSEKYGVELVKELYRTNKFNVIQDKKIEELFFEFRQSLLLKNYSFNKYKAQLYFGGHPIFTKHCPRMTANELKEANKLYLEKEYYSAIEKFKRIYSYSKSYPSLLGIIKSYLKIENPQKAKQILEREIKNFSESQFLFNLELLLADVYLSNNEIEKAFHVYHQLEIQNPSFNYLQEVKFRKLLIDSLGKNQALSFYDRKETERLSLLLRHTNKENFSYLISKLIYFANSSHQDVSKKIEQFTNDFQVHDYFSFQASLTLSNYYFWQGNYEKAKTFAVQAAKFKLDDEEKYYAIENLRMINWFTNYYNEYQIKIFYK